MNEWDQMTQLVAEITGHRIITGDTDWGSWIIVALQKGKMAIQEQGSKQKGSKPVGLKVSLPLPELDPAHISGLQQSDYESWLGREDSSPHPLYPERR